MDRGDTTTYKKELNYLKRKLEDLEEVHRNGKRQVRIMPAQLRYF